MEATKKYQSPPDVAKKLGVNPAKVLGWIERGELAAIDVTHNHGTGRPRWRITPEALADFEQTRSSSTQPSPRQPRRGNHVKPKRIYV